MQILGDHIAQPNLVDIAALAFIAVSMVIGARRGLSGELAGAVSTVVGFVLGLVFFSTLVDWLMDNSRLGETSSRMVAFVLVFLVVFAIMLVMRIGLRLLLKLAIENKADRWGGAMAGMIKSLVLVLAAFLVLIMSPSEELSRMFGEGSMTGSLLIKVLPELKETVAEHADPESDAIRLLDGE
jgi:uncharacterized membrane protein required for colicin V production